MALTTENKLFIAVAVLAGLGGAVWYQNKKQNEEAATYTAEKRSADLPKLEISEEQTKSIDKIVLSKPPGDAGKGVEVTLEKKGENWELTAPLPAAANQTNVTSLLGNLKTLKVTEEIDPSPSAYDKYGVGDAKAVHVTFFKGADKVTELWLGDSGSRGQMARVAGRDGVYSLKGYSSFLYERELKDWRDRTVFKFEEEKVKAVDITNEHGSFAFAISGKAEGDAGAKDAKWTGKFKGAKDAASKAIERFDDAKIKDAIRAYKGLNADNFAEGKTDADTGLDKPAATITITLADGAKRILHIGKTAEGSSRWAKVDGAAETISVGSWAADWALGKIDKFQKPDPKKDGGAEPPDLGGGMPPGMGLPPGMGMPPGMGHGPDDGHGH